MPSLVDVCIVRCFIIGNVEFVCNLGPFVAYGVY